MSQRSFGRFGRLAWALIGILVIAVVAGYVFQRLSLLFIPLILALFPATLLVPVRRTLEGWRLPRTIAALVTLVGSLLLFALLAAGAVTLVASEVPELITSAEEGLSGVEELVQRAFPEFQIPGLDGVLDMLRDRIDPDPDEEGDSGGGLASGVMSVTLGAVEILAGILLFVVILFFYLLRGRELAAGTVDFLAPSARGRVLPLADEAWETLGGYFRGQILVALFDAVLIGIGLLLLGVPMVIPLAALTFIGGLFPIVGAVVAGALAVLVAFADGGLAPALGVAGLVLVVQQIESNVLAPMILSRAVDLQPLAVILSVTLGGILLGVLGAFLAVPTAALVKQLVISLRAKRTNGIIGADG